MNKNPLIFILDENNNYLRYGGTVKALEGYKDQVLVITPQTIAVGNYLSVSMMPKNASYNRYEQYVIPTLEKPSAYIDSDDSLSQTTLTWNVYKTDIKPDALTEFSKFRSGSISFAFAFQQINPSSKCVTYKGVFGVDNPLPTTGQTLGDFYECEDWDYAIESGTHTYAFSKGMYVYWNGTRWVKDRLKTLGSATAVDLPVEPNHAVGAEFDDDETMAVEDIINQVVVNGKNIATNTQDIADMVGGTKAFDEFLMSDGTSVQPSLNANQDGDIMVRDTDGNYKNSQRLVEAESDIDNIEDGTTVVTKALQDQNGNVIDMTYETITDNNDKLDLKVDKSQTIIGIDLQNNIELVEFKTALGNATTLLDGLMSSEDKTHLDTLVALLEDSDADSVVDTIQEILNIFENYPEGADLVTVLAGKVDKVLGKSLVSDTEITKLEALDTQAQLDTKIDLKVDKNLEPLQTLLHSNANTGDLIYVYQPSTNTIRKMTIAEVAVYANTATGSFVDSATYPDLTSGASIMVLIHDAQLDSGGDYKVDLKTVIRDKLVFIKFPTVASTDDLRFSTDNGTTYYNVTKNGSTFKASLVSNQLVRLEFNGTNFIADIQGDVEIEETYQDRIESTYGEFNPLDKGLPLIKEIQGRTIPALENKVENGNFSDVTIDFMATGTSQQVVNNEYELTGETINSSIGANHKDTLIIGHIYYIKFRAKPINDVSSIRIRINDSTYTLSEISAYNQWDTYTHTYEQTVETYFGLRFNSLAIGSKIVYDDIHLIDLTASHGVTETSGTAYDNAVADIEAQLEANGGYISTTPTTHVENSEFKAKGLQEFDKSQYATDYAYKIPVSPSEQYTWSVSALYKTYDVYENELSSGTATTVTTGANTRYIAFSGISNIDTFMLNKGTVATTYAPYNTETQLFNHTALRSTIDKTVYDKIRYENGQYVKDVYINSADNTALATPLLATEVIDVDGTLIQESVTTVEQLQNIPTTYKLEYSMNTEQTTKTLVERDKLQQKEIDNLEDDVTTLIARKTTTNDIFIMSETAWATYEQVDGEVYGVYDESTFVITFYYGQAT